MLAHLEEQLVLYHLQYLGDSVIAAVTLEGLIVVSVSAVCH